MELIVIIEILLQLLHVIELITKIGRMFISVAKCLYDVKEALPIKEVIEHEGGSSHMENESSDHQSLTVAAPSKYARKRISKSNIEFVGEG